MLRGGPDPRGLRNIRSCSLVFLSSSDRVLLPTMCLLRTHRSFTSRRKLALHTRTRTHSLVRCVTCVSSQVCYLCV